MSVNRELKLSPETIEIKALHTLEEMGLVVALQETIWGYGRPGAAFPYPDRCLFEFAESGGLIGGAFKRNAIVGFSAAWIGIDKSLSEKYLHSQLVGVIEPYRNSGVGKELKLHQRDYVRSKNIDLIKWTFDPLKTRNANLNIKKLGGVVRTYTPDYYGNLQSTFNKGLATDRFWVEWYVNSKRVERRLNQAKDQNKEVNNTVVNRITVSNDGYNQLSAYDLNIDETEILVELPNDFENILNKNFEIAKAWQQGIREIFINYFGQGYILDDLLVVDEEGRKRTFYKLSKGSIENILERN